MSQENIDLVRRLFDQLASCLAVNHALDRLSDEALADLSEGFSGRTDAAEAARRAN